MTWTNFLQGSESPGHGVQVYRDADELAASVAEYFAAGFEAGDPGVIVATAEHTLLFSDRLATAGWDAARIGEAGLLATVDAHETLAAIVEDASPATAFDRLVGSLLDGAAGRFPGRRIRVFGELVNLLCLRGEVKSAIALEELWNHLARTRDFSLLCGYSQEIFERESRADALAAICGLHSHALPAAA